jgi:hypothetical protein
MPASVVMNYNDGVYAIDSDAEKSSDAEKNILTWMVCRHPYPSLLCIFIC